jgi:formylglycine-generating enzyme required for sulfatase activity
MSVLFVSHSSKDDVAAGVLETWLHANGFTDIFVDHHSIAGGEKWPEALRASAGACRVVVCLVSENWLTSYDCFNEFLAAWYMGKRIIPLFLLLQPTNLDDEASKRFARVCAEYQGIDLKTCVARNADLDLDADREVASRLKSSLRAAGAISRVGLDPQAFAIDRTHRTTPFPGLVSFGDDDADAALFYGRSREIGDMLEELRKIRAERDLRPFVILGASGAGKSSLLKAGIIPRLRREAPAWLPLRAFRPGADPLLNFAEALSRTLADFAKIEAHGVLRDRLFAVWSKAERGEGVGLTAAGLATLEGALDAEGQKLRVAAGCTGATILISVDQAEEMARADGSSGEALADYLRVALAASNNRWQLAFTIRTDSFPELQSHRRFQDLRARGYDLRAIPIFRFENVVEEPAKRYGVEVDNALVDALMEDAPKEDALPLLAFALQRLWRQYAASGALARDNYDKVGGLRGLIEDAAERALRGIEPEQDVPLSSAAPSRRLIDLGASTFVPAIAQVNEQGATIRRTAKWQSFNDEQQELLARFDRWRLVVRKGEADGGTVEVAHEALFREWTRLKSWLEPERARLDALRSLEVDAATWDRNSRDAAFLNHRDKRLAEANALVDIEGYRKRLGKLEFDYLAACRVAERLARRRARRVQALIYVLFVAIIAGLVGWINQAYVEEQMNWYMTMRPYSVANVRPYVLKPKVERALKPGDSFRECAKDCPEMVVVPQGSFVMGSPVTEKGRYPNEGPQRSVAIVKPFAVSKFHVTFADWDACVSVEGCPQIGDGGFGRGTRPVINVSWDEAQQYTAWFSKMTGRPYRLLTEAEWEYAARAGSTTAYVWGDEIGKGNTNCGSCGSQWDSRETSPVGSFAPNGFGLYDMAGDVWQWVQDCYHDNYNGAPTDGSAWAVADCSRRAVRGGSWLNAPPLLRSASRNGNSTGSRIDYIGFRLGRTLTP